MTYTIDFCIVSAAYLFITAVFYMRQTRIPGLRDTAFKRMLFCGVAALVLDIAAALVDPYAYLHPAWVIYALNIVFLFSVQYSGVLFFNYAMLLTGERARMSSWVRAAYYAPLCVVTVLLLLSPFSRAGIFYLGENNIYTHGLTHKVLYVAMMVYLLSGLVVVIARGRRLQSAKRNVVFVFLGLTFIAMLLQLRYPYLLVNTTAYALSLVLIYHLLEAPSSHIDAMTGAFNRTALPMLLRDAEEQEARYTLLVYPLSSLYLMNTAIGMENGDDVIRAFVKALRAAYPRSNIVRVEGDAFAVLLNGGSYMDAARMRQVYADTPRLFNVRGMSVRLDASLSVINSEDGGDMAGVLSTLEALMRLHRASKLGDVQLADRAFLAACRREAELDKATARALAEDGVEVWYQPIHAADGTLMALEALVRVRDAELGMLPTQEMVERAESNGLILPLGERILEKACAFAVENDLAAWGLHHVGVNLSAVQFMETDIVETIERITARYNVPRGLLAFEITETALLGSDRVLDNMQRLDSAGFSFLLDDFGKGYANFKKMVQLPFRCIKIDKDLLWEARESAEKLSLLRGVIGIVQELGLLIVCEGVEDAEQVALLREQSVAMLQGYYFSKPLPPEALLAYAKKEGAHAV